jgi:hypothetical protein
MTEKEPSREIDSDEVCGGLKTAAGVIAGASLGVIGGVAGIATAAVFEIVLPVSLCLWATGLAGGAAGMILGVNAREKNKKG